MCRGRVARLGRRGRDHVRDRGDPRLGLVTARSRLTVLIVRRDGETGDGAGRCGVCGLGKVGWSGQAIGFFETCSRRESRVVEAGAEANVGGEAVLINSSQRPLR